MLPWYLAEGCDCMQLLQSASQVLREGCLGYDIWYPKGSDPGACAAHHAHRHVLAVLSALRSAAQCTQNCRAAVLPECPDSLVRLTSLSSARVLGCARRAAHRHAACLPSSALAPDCSVRIDIAGIAVGLQRRLRNVAAHAVGIPKLCTACALSA